MAQIAKTGVTWESRPAARKSRRKAPATVPLPKFVEPMYAKLVSQPRPGAWTYEIKFDGYRAIALKGGTQVRLLSRNEKDYGEKFSAINDVLSELDCQDAILDGEVVALDNEGRPSFQLLQALEKGEQRPPLYYYIFDLLHLNGSNLRSQPLEERRHRLQSLLQDAPEGLRFSAVLEAEINELKEKVRSFGLEGLVGKQLGSRYESGRRSGAWIKLKLAREQEFVISGYTPPAGGRKHFGALIVGYYSGDALFFAAKVGSGFSDEVLRSLYEQFQSIRLDRCPFSNVPERRNGRWGQAITPAEMRRCHWVEPNLVCQVRFSEWTQDGKLRQPVFLGLRHDKAAREVVRESAG